MPFVIFDTEYTSWENCMKTGWQGDQKREVVQIGALKVAEDWSVIDRFNRFCQPSINPVLSDYFVTLTGITNEMIQKDGFSFADVYAQFKEFAGTDLCFSHAWGADYFDPADGRIMAENLTFHHLKPDNTISYRNVAALFQTLYQKNHIPITRQSSGQIIKLLNLQDRIADLHLDEHNAYFDVYSVLYGLQSFGSEALELITAKEKEPRC